MEVIAKVYHDEGSLRKAEDTGPTVSAGGVDASETTQSDTSRQALQDTSAPPPTTWFVAIVKRNTEKNCRKELERQGLKAYVATQTVMHRYSKRRPKPVEYVRIPAKVFICMQPLHNAQARTAFFRAHPYIFSFMPDRATNSQTWAEIPDIQMQQMRAILGDPDREVTMGFPDSSYTIGGTVEAVFGPLCGHKGIIASRNGKNYFCIEMPQLEWAKICVSKDDIIPVRE